MTPSARPHSNLTTSSFHEANMKKKSTTLHNYEKGGFMLTSFDGINTADSRATFGEAVLLDKEMNYLLKRMCRK